MSPPCPTRDELDSFQAGDLEETALAAVASHVESCPNCQRSLETIIGDSADTVLQSLLAEPEPRPFAAEAACRLAIERVAAIAAEVAPDAEKFAPTVALELGPNPADDVLPLETIREYKLLAKLGEGGMGAVYKALHTRLDKVVALKVLPQGRMKDGGSVARFQREMKAVGRLDHPNIVRAMDAGEEDGTHFLVMEYVEGADLSLLAKSAGPLPVADACELIRQAALGLQEAHEHGMVHRDIKPSNLILAKPARKKSPPTLKILDLGLALLSEAISPDQGLTSTGQMMGTIDYMAPEQGSDTHRVDIRADIYSLGATLYRLLTGSAPFASEKFDTPVKKILALATKEPAAVQTLRADVSPVLAAIVHKMLAKDPSQRFATPEELAEALAPFCQGANLANLLERGTRPGQTKVSGEAPTHPQLSSPSVATAPTIDYSIKEAKKPRPASPLAFAGLGRKIPRSFAIMAACGGAALIVLLGVVFYLETLKGTIRIEINDPTINVVLDEGRATFQGAHDKHKIRVEPGQHGLIITCGDLKFHTEKFELRKGDILRLSVTFLEGKVEVVDVARNKPLEMTQIQPPKASVNLARTALEFDGKDDYVSLPKISYDFKSPLTFEAWVTPAQSQEDIAEKQAQCLWSRVGCSVELTHWGWQFYCTKRSLIHGRGEAGKRYHLVAQWDGKRCTLFVNGQSATKENAEDFDPAAILPRMLGAGGDWGGRPIGWFFRGRIEEVRVSSVLRYQGDFSPPDPSEPFAADKSTLALYHFDEGSGTELKDSSGHNHHGTIVGAKWQRLDSAEPTLAAPARKVDDAPVRKVDNSISALEFDGKDDYVSLPRIDWDRVSPLTFEAWVTPAVRQKQITTAQAIWAREGCFLIAEKFGWQFYAHQVSAIGGRVRGGQRQHLVAQWDGTRCRLFVDGVGFASDPAVVDPKSLKGTGFVPRVIGAIGNYRGEPVREHFAGRMDEVRISSSVRYPSDFQPPQRFEADADTIALYHMGEGQGDVLTDSSGHNHHGKIVGAKWVKVEGVSTPGVAGWHGWPKEAPKPAIAPFTAAEARKHQEEWATYLGVPADYENSLRMKFVLIPPGEYTMGSTPAEIEATLKLVKDKQWQECIQGEGPQHKVILTQPIYLGVHEVTQADYAKVMGKSPSFFAKTGPLKSWVEKVAGLDTARHPVEGVSWNDAAEFCAELSEREKLTPCYSRSGETVTMLSGTGYRLPTEAQWEFGCRAGTTTKYWSGNKDEDLAKAGWFGTNSGARTHQAGELQANPFGLCDVHGNAWEWVQDWWSRTTYGQFQERPALDPSGASAGSLRVIRGGDCSTDAYPCRSADHFVMDPLNRSNFIGFRAVLPVQAVEAALAERTTASAGWHGWPKDAPSPAIAPFDAKQARKHQEEWATYLNLPLEYENSLNMKFILIPPGEFMMGSTLPEVDELVKAWDVNDPRGPVCIKSATPQHKVILTRPMYASIHEVTQKNYQAVMGNNPSVFAKTGVSKELAEKVAGMDTANFAVDSVSWLDATDFCSTLSRREKLQSCYDRVENKVTLREANGYRLPSEAEWEFSCRAGTTTPYWFGDGNADLYTAGWFGAISGGRPHAVGELRANPLGLYDLHGNAGEWVQDWWEPNYHEPTKGEPVVNPQNESVSGKSERVLRGGNWRGGTWRCRSSFRDSRDYWHRDQDYGFRVWLSTDAVKTAIAERKTQRATPIAGWHGWPADAPKPAIAPFTAEQAKERQQEWASYLNVPVEYENSLRMKFVLIPPGEFMMGSPQGEIEKSLQQLATKEKHWQDYVRSEGPQHRVVLTQPFYLGIVEVTQKPYTEVMKNNPSHYSQSGPGKDNIVGGEQTDDHPVEMVTWLEAAEFCARLSDAEKLQPVYTREGDAVSTRPGNGYRLPSEAEWEFACRAGTTTAFWSGDQEDTLPPTAWFVANSKGSTRKTGTRQANPFGLYDMHGNVWEWLEDYYESEHFGKFQSQPAINPAGPTAGSQRVVRGGDWVSPAFQLRSSSRVACDPPGGNTTVGFRTAISVDGVRQALKERAANQE